jgi:thiol-disulfide isomerase/thioredoxin
VIEAENRRRHQKSAELYTAMSEAAAMLAGSEDLLPTAPASIEKKESQRIKGSWNLYQNVPNNAADLRQEALFMKYRALGHETALDPNKIGAMHDFVAGLEQDADLEKLFQTSKRNVCARMLSYVQKPLNDHIEKPEKPLPSESALGEKLFRAVQWFAPFVQKYPNEENLKLVDSFLDTIEQFRFCYPDSERLPELTEPFRSAFAHIKNQKVVPLIREYAEIYEGGLRRQELLGKPMPIWGADLAGNRLDEKTLEGKVVLLDFWATWCGPCIAEFPHLKLLYQKYKDKGFEIVGYSVDADQERLRDYLARNPVPWMMLSKGSTERTGLPALSQYYGAKSLPVVLLRDRSGKTVLLDARGQKLDEMLERLFETQF